MRTLRIWGVVTAIALLIGTLGGIAQGAHQTGSFESCHGTYLVERTFNPGAPFEFVDQAMWTFSEDGTFQGTSSSELTSEFPFSHKQGAWTATDDFEVNMVNLDFEWVGAKKNKGPYFLDGVARNDSVVDFFNGCSEFDATFGFHFYSPEEDPLDPNAGFPSGGGTATGRLLVPLTP